jgi:hypothetical protein
MYDDEMQHPLYGKDTTCHVCKGEAVWVLNGSSVGNYHYCRACKIETGPFARNIKLPALEPPPAPVPRTTNDDWFWQQLTMDLGRFNGAAHSTHYGSPFDLTGDEEGLMCSDDGDCEACGEDAD